MKKTAQIHRFHDRVAFYVGDSGTVYMSAKDARRFARALNACARNIGKEPVFHASHFATIHMEYEDGKQ